MTMSWNSVTSGQKYGGSGFEGTGSSCASLQLVSTSEHSDVPIKIFNRILRILLVELLGFGAV